MEAAAIEALVAALDVKSTVQEEIAWDKLRPLGAKVVPYLLKAYPQFRKWQGRACLVYHATRYSRTSDDAFRLGLAAIDDRATVVRYRACGVLAYSLRHEAIFPLTRLLAHSDSKTVKDARAAIDAIKCKNHHLFHDRDHSARVRWIVNDSDREA